MTPAEELRAAAARIRGVAEAATHGPWLNLDCGDRIVTEPDSAGEFEYVLDEPLDANNAAHIALWDPTVALLVADLLDRDAGLGNTGTALALARAINGGAS